MNNIEEYSCEERKAIEELRLRMKNSLGRDSQDDVDLFYRFLKARDFDVDKAEIMLRKNNSWRKAFQVDNIVDTFEPKEVFLKYYDPSLIGFDKEGNLVRYRPLGKFDMNDLLKSLKSNDYLKHLIWCYERDRRILHQESKKRGRTCKSVFILDLDELTLANVTHRATLELQPRIVHHMQDNYPECMKAIYVINAPAYHIIVFSILKMIMSNAMLRKIHIFAQTGWKEALLEQIDADVLPAFLGGNRTDPDGNPLCKSFICHGGRIPPKYFLSNEERTFKNIGGVRSIVVPQMAKRNVFVEVKEQGSLIQWEFETKNKEIGFGLFYQESEQELKEVLPVQKFIFSDGVETGSFKSQLSGTYVITFDNSNSWWSSKEVSYCITILDP